MKSFKNLFGSVAMTLLLSPGAAISGDLIYSPVNPAFGGNPDIFNYLIGTAQVQNEFADQGGGGGGGAPPTINFPPIVIDLGGAGGDPDPNPDPTPDANASRLGAFTINNSKLSNQ